MSISQVGTLVVDLIANSAAYINELRNANQQTSRFARDVSRSMDNLAGNIAGLAAGYLGLSAIIAQTNRAMADAKEIENMSRLAGQSVEEFQAATYATEQYGVSMEKFGDISKDVSDKLGDFTATGGGEFQDFFEQVAPQVGLTSAELEHLSGPEVLLAVKKAMDDANIPMKEQIFYLESIANDASLLIPLLENNGQAYRDLTREAHAANAVISEADISALRESEKIITSLSKQMSAAFASAVAGSAEQLNWLATVASGIIRQIGAELDALNDRPNTLAGSIEKIAELQEEIDELSDSIERLEKNKSAYNRDTQLAAKQAQLARLKQELKALQEHRWGQQETFKPPKQPKLPDVKPVDVKPAEDAAQKIIDANQRTLDSLTRQLATEEQLIEQTYEKRVEEIENLVLTEEQLDATKYDTLLQLQADYLLQAEAARQESLEKLKQGTENSTNEMEIQFAALANAINVNTETMERSANSWANSFSSEMANMVTTGEMDFGRLAESIINDLIRIAIQANITNAILDAMGMGGGSSGGDSGTKPDGELATGGPVMRGSTYLVGEQGPELFTASNSGSITPNNQLGSNTSVNIYTQPGETAETRTRTTPQGDIVEVFMKQIDSRMNEQISRGQGLARTLEGRYSLTRKAY